MGGCSLRDAAPKPAHLRKKGFKSAEKASSRRRIGEFRQRAGTPDASRQIVTKRQFGGKNGMSRFHESG
jgi:hypothetical protein